jgi:hypothetical protein
MAIGCFLYITAFSLLTTLTTAAFNTVSATTSTEEPEKTSVLYDVPNKAVAERRSAGYEVVRL